jgi:hypothetical protein
MIITHDDLLKSMADERCGWRLTTADTYVYLGRNNGGIIAVCCYPASVHESMTPQQIRDYRFRLLKEWVFGNQQQEQAKGGGLSNGNKS